MLGAPLDADQRAAHRCVSFMDMATLPRGVLLWPTLCDALRLQRLVEEFECRYERALRLAYRESALAFSLSIAGPAGFLRKRDRAHHHLPVTLLKPCCVHARPFTDQRIRIVFGYW